MNQDFDWEEGEPQAPPARSRRNELAYEARLDRQRRVARHLARSTSRWLIVAAIALFYGGYTVFGLRRGFFPFDGNLWLLPISAVIGVAGLAGMARFEGSVRLYESINYRYYRDRRRLIGPELNAMLGNLLFAGAGVGTVIGYAVHFLLRLA